MYFQKNYLLSVLFMWAQFGQDINKLDRTIYQIYQKKHK